ncbi:L,D-transpeptidase family protein [Sphingobium cloacae]|uniref:L,D-transpeptidase n=1 Tax=Sphingobium cloacae TaxID=120107 RepID=A0A1E1F5Z6_9SPHN|nr:L,D-transpeptidase family protein [Sphingobium cloacae]BAV65929.1 L,D-transpeptidase [Sphingobium cloacae]
MAFALRAFCPLLAFAACVALPLVARAAPVASDPIALAPGEYRWLSEGPWAGPIYMVISIEKQMVHVYDGDRLIGAASVSTGMKGHRTPTGEFPILQKRQWHRSNLYSNAPMPFMQRLTWDGIALHAGHNPGYPASHGCIRLPHAFARKLFDLTRIGTQVNVTTDRLSPALMVGTLVLEDPNDPSSAIVTFTPVEEAVLAERPALPQAAGKAERVPALKVDPAIFRPRLMR